MVNKECLKNSSAWEEMAFICHAQLKKTPSQVLMYALKIYRLGQPPNIIAQGSLMFAPNTHTRTSLFIAAVLRQIDIAQ